MPENKVLFGLTNAHVAFQNKLPGKAFAVLTAPTADGTLTVTVTAAGVTGTPKAVTVSLVKLTHTSATLTADAIAAALNADTAVKAMFNATSESGIVSLIAKAEPETPDATFAVSVDPGETGVTTGSVLTTETIGFDNPVPLKGAVNLAVDPEGDSYVFYADDGPYFSITSNNGYSGDFEMALLPDSIAVPMIGHIVDDQGMVVEIADGKQRPFALLCQFTGDQKNRKIVYWNCMASRPSDEHKTKEEGIEVDVQTLPLVIQPIEIGGKKIVKGSIELLGTPSPENTLAYNSFFSQVILPKFA
ncbi:hypothetical protein DSECCO2_570760 [anaerobic digester metagenome]